MNEKKEQYIWTVLCLKAPQENFYKPASGPAYATATNVAELGLVDRFDPIPYHDGGADVPADQRSLEQAVIDGANSFNPDVSFLNLFFTR